jgi:AraC-like DNA-binding protein
VSYKNGQPKANRVLALLILGFSLSIGLPKLVREYRTTLPHLILLNSPLTFLVGPLLYYYGTLLMARRPVSFKQFLPHLLPYLIATSYLMPFYFQSAGSKVEFALYTAAHGLSEDLILMWVLKNIHLFVYVVGLIWVLSRHAHMVKSAFSNVERINLSWLKHLVVGIAVVWLVNFGLFIAAMLQFAQSSARTAGVVAGSLLSLLVYSVGFKGFRQPEIFANGRPSVVDLEQKRKYERSGLTPERAAEFEGRLIAFMGQEKPYRDADITLLELAKAVSIPQNLLSQVINEQLGKSFFDFVNEHRVEEAKRILADANLRHLTILAVAYEAGFNSKSAFYRAFKKSTHMTPSQFLAEPAS